MSGVYSSTVTGIFVRKFWVWPPQNIYPWQKSSSEVTKNFQMKTTAISNSSRPKGWSLMFVNDDGIQ